MVITIAITAFGARWVLEISGGHSVKLYDCLTAVLYTWNQHQTALKANCH